MKLSQIVEAAARERQAKKRFPRPMQDKGGSPVWICCSEVFKDRNRQDEPMWVAVCLWKKGSKIGATRRVVGRPAKDPNNPDAAPVLGPKPTTIQLKSKTIRKC